MKILMVNIFYYYRGGDSTYTFELSRLLQKRGHRVIPFAMQHSNNLASPYSQYFVNCIDYPKLLTRFELLSWLKVLSRIIYSTEARGKIETLINVVKPDVAHLQNINYHITPSILLSLKKYNIPIVWTLHDYGLICPNSLLFCNGKICERCKSGKFYNAVVKKCKKKSYTASSMVCIESYVQQILKVYNLVSEFITPSLFLKNKLIEYGFDKEHIVHIPNFTNIDAFAPSHNSHKEYIVYFGRVSEEKGLKTLVKAVRGINKIKLFIIGEGPVREELEKFVELNNMKNVKFLGYKSREELIAIVKNAMFTVVPSKWYENFPYSILESFALGKPVIGSRIGGIPELIEDEVTGLLFQPGDVNDLENKLRFLLIHRELIKRMGENARRRMMTKYTSSVHYEKIMEVYRGIR